MVDWSLLLQYWLERAYGYLPKLAGALFILIIGWIFVNWFTRFMDGQMKRRKVDRSLRPFFHSILLWSLRILLLITAISMLGVQMTSFIAILGAAGLAIGLALQGSLSNFAGGVLIISFKPFVVDEYIEAQGVGGTVRAIKIFHTTVLTPDNKYVTIPNGNLANQVIINYSRMDTRRLDLIFSIGYDDDIDKVKKLLLQIMKKDKRILPDPQPEVFVKEHAASSVNLITRCWVKKEDYAATNFALHEIVKKEFDKNKISIPFPQQVMHMVEAEK